MEQKPGAKKPTTTTSPAAPSKGVQAAIATPDWERIELDYRAGIKTLRQMAAEHGISHVAINKRAKREEWTRDLSAKIKQKADDLVTKALVTKEVTKERRIAERQIIDEGAHALTEIRLSQRKDIQRSRSITMALLAELEQQTGADNVALLEQLGELLRREDENGQDKLNDLYHKIISLPGRAKTMKDLGESLRVLVALERQAFGLDDKDNAQVDPLTALLHGIAKSSGNAFRPIADDPEHGEAPAGGFQPVSDPEEEED